MDVNQVIVISKTLSPVPPSEVEQLENELGIKLPSGYVQFITTFGEGEYCDFFRIYPPPTFRGVDSEND